MYVFLQILINPSEVKKVKLEDLSKTMTVTELQQRIEQEVGIPASTQKLIHKGKVLSGLNGEILLHYKINYNETIQARILEKLY